MVIDIVVADEDLEQVEEEYGKKVRKRLKRKIGRKEDELQWMNSTDQALQRFYNPIGENGFSLAEMKMDFQGRSFRALLIPVSNSFVFWDFVEKDNNYKHSRQRRVLDRFHQNPGKVVDEAKEKYMDIKNI